MPAYCTITKAASLIAARDQIGIRPLFYGYSKSGKIAFASEAKNLIGWVDEVRAFPPGSYYYDGKFVKYEDIAAVHGYVHEDIDVITKNIHDKLTEGVKETSGCRRSAGLFVIRRSGLKPCMCNCSRYFEKTDQDLCNRHGHRCD